MIASVLTLSRTDCKALEIADIYGIHKTVYSLFPKRGEENRDFLFADKGGDFYARKILVLSKRAPLIPDVGSIESKKVPEQFLHQDHYGFEIRLNPTKREKATGKTAAIRGRENLIAWFINKAPSFGFNVEPESLSVQDLGIQSFKKDGVTVLHNKATFIGKLTVADRGLFIESFENGIGRAKSFGFGLLQIVPITSEISNQNRKQNKE